MADSGGSRKRYRDPEATQGYQVESSSSLANTRYNWNQMAKRRLRRRVGSSRRTVSRGGYRRSRRRSVRRVAASYVPPQAKVSATNHRGAALVERTPCHIQRSLNPFPPMWKGHLTYGILESLTTSAGNDAILTHAYGMNNMHDPRTGLGGHQPYQYDQLLSATGPYLSCTVLGFSYSLKFSDPTADGVFVGVAWRGWSDTQGTPTGKLVDQIIEQGRCNYQILSNTGSQTAEFSGYVDLPSMAGLTPDQYVAGGNYGHLYNTNPGARQDFYMMAAQLNGDAVAPSVRITGWLRYHCILGDLVSLPQS